MKRLLATTALIAIGFAANAQSSDLVDRVSAELSAQGYTDIESEVKGDTTVIEATIDGVEFEFVYDTSTEDLLETVEEPADHDDDDQDEAEDDNDEDEDGDDEDEDEDDDEDDEEDDEDDND